MMAARTITASERQPPCALSLARQVEAEPEPELVRERLERQLSLPGRAKLLLSPASPLGFAFYLTDPSAEHTADFLKRP